jgi:hypothetical protein
MTYIQTKRSCNSHWAAILGHTKTNSFLNDAIRVAYMNGDNYDPTSDIGPSSSLVAGTPVWVTWTIAEDQRTGQLDFDLFGPGLGAIPPSDPTTYLTVYQSDGVTPVDMTSANNWNGGGDTWYGGLNFWATYLGNYSYGPGTYVARLIPPFTGNYYFGVWLD